MEHMKKGGGNGFQVLDGLQGVPQFLQTRGEEVQMRVAKGLVIPVLPEPVEYRPRLSSDRCCLDVGWVGRLFLRDITKPIFKGMELIVQFVQPRLVGLWVPGLGERRFHHRREICQGLDSSLSFGLLKVFSGFGVHESAATGKHQQKREAGDGTHARARSEGEDRGIVLGSFLIHVAHPFVRRSASDLLLKNCLHQFCDTALHIRVIGDGRRHRGLAGPCRQHPLSNQRAGVN